MQGYRAPRWLPGGNLQTIWAATLAQRHDGAPPQFLLLNLAIGGDLGGPVDDAHLPATMEVDYVRVWQAPPARP